MYLGLVVEDKPTEFSCIHAYLDEVFVALSPLVGNAGQMGVPLLTVATNHTAIVELVLAKVALRIVVTVDVDLGEGVVGGRLLYSFMDTRLKQRQ
jgi:hypothetical protein